MERSTQIRFQQILLETVNRRRNRPLLTFFFSNRSTLETELKIKSNGLKQIVAERFVRLFCSLESEPPLSDGALQRHWTAGNQICRPPAASPAAATQSPRDRRISLASAPPLNLSHLGFSACVPAPFESGPPLPFLLQQVHFAPILFPAPPPLWPAAGLRRLGSGF